MYCILWITGIGVGIPRLCVGGRLGRRRRGWGDAEDGRALLLDGCSRTIIGLCSASSQSKGGSYLLCDCDIGIYNLIVGFVLEKALLLWILHSSL